MVVDPSSQTMVETVIRLMLSLSSSVCMAWQLSPASKHLTTYLLERHNQEIHKNYACCDKGYRENKLKVMFVGYRIWMVALMALGDSLQGSGLEQVWVRADITGQRTHPAGSPCR